MEYEYLPILCNNPDLLSIPETHPFSKAKTRIVMKKKISKIKLMGFSISPKHIKTTITTKQTGSSILKASGLNVVYLSLINLYKLKHSTPVKKPIIPRRKP
jgi:hypothetical protein